MEGPLVSFGPRVGPPVAAEGGTELARAAADFEALVLHQLLKQSSRPLLAGDTPLTGGSAGRMYRDLWFQELAKAGGARGALGFGRLLEEAGD